MAAPAALALIKEFEGCELTAYPDGNGVPTIAYGHTGPEVVEGMACTQAQADAWLIEDSNWADEQVMRTCPAATQPQHDAMTSFCFNVGVGNFRGSSVVRFHNTGAYELAAQSFGLWNKVDGEISAGLTRRRAAEAALYSSGATGETQL